MSTNESSNALSTTGRRILLECDDPAIQDGLERALHESGFTVSVCAGPASRSSGCPLLTSGRCGLVDDAEIVVHALDPADQDNRDVFDALARAHPDTPIIVETDLEVDGTHDVRRVRFPMSRAALLEAVSVEWSRSRR